MGAILTRSVERLFCAQVSILTSIVLSSSLAVVDREMFAVTKRTSLVSWLEEWFSSLFY